MSKPIVSSVGWSSNPDASRAGRESAEMALSRLSSRHPRLALVFASSWFDQVPLLSAISQALGQIPTVGCSTAGEIVLDGPASHSCLVLLLASDVLQWGVGLGEGVDRDPRQSGQQAAYAAARGFHGSQRLGFLIFGDGLTTSYADAIRGIQEVLGTNALIFGALAGDDLRFTATHQYINGRVATKSLVGVLFGGEAKIGVGIEHGFAPVSKPRQITKAHANLLVELDHEPAASVYEEYLGAESVRRMRAEGVSRQGVAYPLGLQCEEAGHWLLRSVVSFGEDGSLACSGELIEGAWLQLMLGSRSLVMDAASRAAVKAVQAVNQAAFVLVFDSFARKKLLGQRQAAQEIAVIRQAVGPGVPIVGCYTYGEQAPLGNSALVGGKVCMQTGSILVAAFGV